MAQELWTHCLGLSEPTTVEVFRPVQSPVFGGSSLGAMVVLIRDWILADATSGVVWDIIEWVPAGSIVVVVKSDFDFSTFKSIVVLTRMEDEVDSDEADVVDQVFVHHR